MKFSDDDSSKAVEHPVDAIKRITVGEARDMAKKINNILDGNPTDIFLTISREDLIRTKLALIGLADTLGRRKER